jgi:hypothetical protein
MYKKRILLFLIFFISFLNLVNGQHYLGQRLDKKYYHSNEFHKNPALLDVQNRTIRLSNEEWLRDNFVSNTSVYFFDSFKNYSYGIAGSFFYNNFEYEDGGVLLESILQYGSIETFHKYRFSEIISAGLEAAYQKVKWELFQMPMHNNLHDNIYDIFTINTGLGLKFNNYNFSMNYRKQLNSSVPALLLHNKFGIQNSYKYKSFLLWITLEDYYFFDFFDLKNFSLLCNIGMSYQFKNSDVFAQYNINEKRIYLNTRVNYNSFDFIIGGFYDFNPTEYMAGKEHHTIGANSNFIYYFKK